MSIYLLSLSHKTTPLEIRSWFAYDDTEKNHILEELLQWNGIDEAVVLATCNRMEIYCHGTDKELYPAGSILEGMEQAAVNGAREQMRRCQKEQAEEGLKGIGGYFRRYCDRQAVHHLFQVAAGLDSMVLGEDQILGQVKQAYEFSHERGYCQVYLNTLFRDAITGAKRVKTDTELSKTPVSTATLAVKAAEEKLKGLSGRKMMIIGATGRIGNIILKNVQGIPDLEIYVTMRSHSSPEKLGHGLRYQVISYEERYQWMDEMDVIISATSSPHYTMTAYEMEQHVKKVKERVFLDLAVPPDIEKPNLSLAWYYNIEDMTQLARRNNEQKMAELATADRIIEEYENRFYKWLLYKGKQPVMEEWKETIIRDVAEKGAEAAISRLLYKIREAGSVEEVEGFLSAVGKANEEERRKDQMRPAARMKGLREEEAYFPLFFPLKNRKVLVVGAGKIACRRAEALAEFGARVWMVAPQGNEQALRLERDGAVKWEKRCFVPEDIKDCELVIAATDDSQVNRQIALLCREQQILVNHAGDKSLCDFYFPGIAREGNLVAGVTASGKDHKMASEITGRLQSWLKQFAHS